MKKTIVLVTLVCFLVFSCSCAFHKWEMVKLDSIKPEKRESAKISAVKLHSGKKIELNKNPAARIQGDSVVGVMVESLAIDKSKIKSPATLETGSAARILTTDGVTYKAKRIIAQDDSSVTFDAHFPASIPLADIDFVWTRRVNVLATVLLYVVPIGGAFAIMAAAMHGFSVMGGGVGGWFAGPW